MLHTLTLAKYLNLNKDMRLLHMYNAQLKHSKTSSIVRGKDEDFRSCHSGCLPVLSGGGSQLPLASCKEPG